MIARVTRVYCHAENGVAAEVHSFNRPRPVDFYGHATIA
jgi:hypothetical protein